MKSQNPIFILQCTNYFLVSRNIISRVLALMKNINDNALALMFKMVNE